MEVLSKPIMDNKIGAYNVMCQLSLKEYYELVKDSMKKNEFQRKRVPSAKNIYSLLKDDLVTGCIIPPIVLSIFDDYQNLADDKATIIDYVNEHKDNLIILDGLQRTFTIQEIYNQEDLENKDEVLKQVIRVEFYLGLNREGVLYRMLTLNTGQTRMSLRHQIEMIYRDLLFKDNDAHLVFLKDTDKKQKATNIFYFNEAVDAFTSFLNGDYLQITREKLLDTIETFSELSKLKNNRDAFIDLMKLYSLFLKKANELLDGRTEDIEEYAKQKDIKPLFGNDAISLFNKSQCMTGFAAAVYRLLDLGCYDNILDISEGIDSLQNEDFYDGVIKMISCLDDIRNHASKIGNSQRCWFYYFFKNLMDNQNTDTYMKVYETCVVSQRNYSRDY